MKLPLTPEASQNSSTRSHGFLKGLALPGTNEMRAFLWIFAAALCYAYSLAVHAFGFYRKPVGAKLLMLSGLVLGFIVLLTVLRRHWVIEKFINFPGRTRVLLVAASSAALLFLALVSPYRKPPSLTVHHLEIEATGERYRSADSAEVSVMSLVNTDGYRIPRNDLRITGEWADGDHDSILLKPGTKLTYHGRFMGGLNVKFIRSINSGIASVNWDGVEMKVDLYSPDSRIDTLPLSGSSWGRPGILWGAMGAGILIADIFTVISILVFGGVWLVYHVWARTSRFVLSRWSWLGYALPSVIVWGISWLAFFPALMTFDSVDAWSQALSGRYNDMHSVLYTLLMRFFAFTWETPAAVAVLQILVLAMAAAAVLRFLERAGVPTWACWIASFAFALSPVNLIFSITLWKDIFYSVAVLLFILLILAAVYHRRRIKRLKIFWVVVGLMAGLIPLLRHNGIIVVGATVLLCFLFIKDQRPQWVLVLALGLGLWFFVTGPVYEALKVKKYPMLETLIIHHMAAYVASDVELTASEIQYLSSIGPIEKRWYYDCYDNVSTFTGSDFFLGVIRRSQADFYRLYRSLILRRPDILMNHLLCSSSMIWRIEQNPDSLYQTARFDKIEDLPNTFDSINLISEPIFPDLRERIIETERSIGSNWYGWVFWRPAFHLYLVTGIFLLVSFRKRSYLYLLPLAPVLAQSLGLLAMMPSQAFRYQYAVYLAASLLWLLVFIPRAEEVRAG
jgi:hypothetical protein